MEAWDRAWQTEAGRQGWLTPAPFVAESIPPLRGAGVQRVLDLGLGVGRHALLLAQAGFTVYGLDASPNGLVYAAAWAERERVPLHLAAGNMTHLPYADGAFDAVLSWNVIYHGTVDVIRRSVAEIGRCLRPNGYLLGTFISTRHKRYGRGHEIEPNTFIIPGGGETSHPHHYSDRPGVASLLAGFALLRCEDAEQGGADTWHWQFMARRGG